MFVKLPNSCRLADSDTREIYRSRHFDKLFPLHTQHTWSILVFRLRVFPSCVLFKIVRIMSTLMYSLHHSIYRNFVNSTKHEKRRIVYGNKNS